MLDRNTVKLLILGVANMHTLLKINRVAAIDIGGLIMSIDCTNNKWIIAHRYADLPPTLFFYCYISF